MFPVDRQTKQHTQPTYAQITKQPTQHLLNYHNEQQVINDLNAISYKYSQSRQPTLITNELYYLTSILNQEENKTRLRKCNLFEDAPSESLDLATFNTPPKKTKKNQDKIKVKNTPSKWRKFYCDPPSTPSSTDDEYDEYNDNTINMFEIIEETNEKKEINEKTTDKSYNLWINKICNNIYEERKENVIFTYYNKITGGKCYEIEEKCKPVVINNIYLSYLNNINKNNIFHLNEASIYEQIFIYLDGKSIFNGIMLTCKKLYYFKFMDESMIWMNLLMRDFHILIHNYFNLEIPYINTYASFKDTILLRPNERKLYFTKIKNDKFWGLLFNLQLKNINLNNLLNDDKIENIWKNIKWIDLLFGKNNDYGFYAYKQLIQLQQHSYIKSFGNDTLPTDKIIEYFCNAIRKNMPSGISILYLSPWIKDKYYIEWTKRKILWLDEYKQCWALSQSDKYFYDEIHKLPNIIKLMGQIQFQNGKSFKPDNNEWLPFLKTFDPNIKQYNQIKDGWFQKQFMLNEMENRLKNIRNLIEIVRQ